MKRSDLIIPISIVVHLFLINGILTYFDIQPWKENSSLITLNAIWLFMTFFMDFYPTARKERFFDKFHKFIQVFLLFNLAYFTVLAFDQHKFNVEKHFSILATIFSGLFIYRLLFFYLRDKYRLHGGNTATVVIIGKDKNLKKIQNTLCQPELGYKYHGFFDTHISKDPNYLGTIDQAIDYILENHIEEVYCTASRLSQVQLRALIRFADNNLKKIKIIPDNKEIFSRAMKVELFETIPVLNLRKLPLESEIAQLGKRFFDIIFSSFIIVSILSWLTPILFILIKLESKGPLFFKQLRHGYNRKTFGCYKFRSMAINEEADTKMSTKGDARITKVGKFMRKTSIDELPQFINVFLGDMSVVGPRPHMESHTHKYEVSIDKYLVRHFAKPGITGLAQVKGYRGEIVTSSDIINRTRMDIFYLERWSPLLDLKIIYSTLANAVKGEEKAY
ncbi:MAG: exopolysaccharide biosynthesis polyprenyl glycosylphosphotransferase [Candidatus Bathyarchaeota archaeon]|nr:exopolysaccharide biosynthesis polyprenyl glycosylphosphotransferase [Candidatus Bathyarchaeota archaeon]